MDERRENIPGCASEYVIEVASTDVGKKTLEVVSGQNILMDTDEPTLFL